MLAIITSTNQGLINNFLHFQGLSLKFGIIFHVACAPCLKGLLTETSMQFCYKLFKNENNYDSKKNIVAGMTTGIAPSIFIYINNLQCKLYVL